MQRFIDTGSPATVVSIECLIEACWKRKPSDQPRDEWEDDLRYRIEPTRIVLKGCGGGRLLMAGQVLVTLRRREYSCTTVVQVQRLSPVPLLLGTNVLPKLGFALIQPQWHSSRYVQ